MNTTNVCPRTLRHLVGAYLARPDPDAWNAAADLFEEAGDLRSATRWRRRARWYPPLAKAWVEATRPDARWVTDVRLGRLVALFMTDFGKARHAVVCLLRASDRVQVHGERWQTGRADSYDARKIVSLIDRYAFRFEEP